MKDESSDGFFGISKSYYPLIHEFSSDYFTQFSRQRASNDNVKRNDRGHSASKADSYLTPEAGADALSNMRRSTLRPSVLCGTGLDSGPGP